MSTSIVACVAVAAIAVTALVVLSKFKSFQLHLRTVSIDLSIDAKR